MDTSNQKQENDRLRLMKFMQKHHPTVRSYIREKELNQFEGTGVYCPVCYSEFCSFAPFHTWIINNEKSECVTNNKSTRCPKCGSLERHRLLWKYLHEKTDIFNNENKRVLEFAPDEPFYNEFMAKPNIHYFPCDINPENLKFANLKGIIKADICQIPFEDNYFDIVLCSHVLEHISDDRLAMSELFRVMKKGGWGIFQVPVDYNREKTYEDFTITSPEGREQAFGQKDHVRWYGKDYKNRLEEAGFIVKEDDYVNSFSTEDIVKYGFDKFEVIYYCEKQIVISP